MRSSLDVGQKLGSLHRCCAEAIGSIFHRLLQEKGIIFAGLQLAENVLVVLLPSMQGIVHGESGCGLFRKNSIWRGVAHRWEARHQAVWGRRRQTMM